MTLQPLLDASPVIQIHAACAFLALILGGLQLFRKKGDPLHRAIGFTWVGLMTVVAVSSFFIWTIRLWGPFSPIHLISIFVLVMLVKGVQHARRHQIEDHRRTMEYTYFLGLVITGLLTFIPGRTMYWAAFGPDGATPGKLAIFAGVVLVVAAIGGLVARWRKTPEGQAFVESH